MILLIQITFNGWVLSPSIYLEVMHMSKKDFLVSTLLFIIILLIVLFFVVIIILI